MCKTKTNSKFMNLGAPQRIWAVPAIHAQMDDLVTLHNRILKDFNVGDKLVYHGNYTGYGEDAVQTIDEILAFRRIILSVTGVRPSDIIYLRGAQEEMWEKLLQLQFAPDPTSVLLWMLSNGLDKTLYSYGLSPHDGIESCRKGIMSLMQWTNKIRAAVRTHPGHEIFSTHLVRATHTNIDTEYPMLFVHAGLDARKPLEKQGDHLWWGHPDFKDLSQRYQPFEKVIRGYDPKHEGLHFNCVTATIDGGSGFGGKLVCAGFAQNGDVFNVLEA